MYIVVTFMCGLVLALAIAKVLNIIFGFPFELTSWSLFGFFLGILQISGAINHKNFSQSDDPIKVKSFDELSNNFWGDLADGYDPRLSNFDQYKWAWILIILSAVCSFVLLPGIIIRNKTVIYSVLYLQLFINLFFFINLILSSPKPNYVSIKVILYITVLAMSIIIPPILMKISDIQ